MTFGATIAAEWKGFDVNLLFQGGGGFNVIYFEQLQYPLCFGGNGLAEKGLRLVMPELMA